MEVIIKWDNGNIQTCDKEKMKTITLAYAMSIHKSQGSEYKSVIIPMLSSQICPLHKRNLLYTGVTRSKDRVYIVGDINAINLSIRRTDSNIRRTQLKQRLIVNYARMCAPDSVQKNVQSTKI